MSISSSKLKAKYELRELYDFVNSVTFQPFFLLFLFLMSTGIKDDTDFYFIIENGKKIVTDMQFPHVDWMSMHEGLHIVIQQWVVSVIDYFVYSTFGEIGIFVLFSCVYFLFYLILYKMFLMVSKNAYFRSYVLTMAIAMVGTTAYGNARPQVFSAIFVALAIYLMQMKKTDHNWSIIFPMMGIALLQANFHSTFFIAIIGVYGSYAIFNSISKKKIDWPILLGIPLSIVVGLLNPYGYEALIQPLYTRGYALYSTVTELAPISGTTMVIILLVPIAILFSEIGKHKISLSRQGSIAFLTFVTTMATVLAIRSMIFYFIPTGAFIASYGIYDKKVKTITDTGKKYSLDKFMSYGLCIVLIVVCAWYNYDNFSISKQSKILALMPDMIESAEKQGYDFEDKTVLPTNIIEGQYLYHTVGAKSFIDGRLETYIDSLNKKYDYSTEFYNYYKSITPASELIEKYKFDYIFGDPTKNASLSDYLDSTDDYKLIYTTDTPIKYQLYVRNDK